jgi:hypothetical protein
VNLVVAIYDALNKDTNNIFSLKDIVSLCRDKPELVDMNKNVTQKVGIPIKIK